jgi:hypothetical protein
MPAKNAYGTWPASGEIDLTESRGNLNLMLGGKNIGAEMTGSTLHFGPYVGLNAYEKAHFERNSAAGQGFDKDFHNYQMEWTPGKNTQTSHFNFTLRISSSRSIIKLELIPEIQPCSHSDGFLRTGNNL